MTFLFGRTTAIITRTTRTITQKEILCCHSLKRQPLQFQQFRWISTNNAMRMLGFPKGMKPKQVTVAQLRMAYFDLAKRTHPDLQKSQETSDTWVDFRDITEAYEHLLHHSDIISSSKKRKNTTPLDDIISKEEEDLYRQACLSMLGIPAEIVEESKQNAMFRHWLAGNTDGAQHWRAFFAVHGGLAQKLRTPTAYLESGTNDDYNNNRPSFESRPRRGRR